MWAASRTTHFGRDLIFFCRRGLQIWKKKFIKVLIVGDSGLGKTTLVKTLLSTPGERLQVRRGWREGKRGVF